MTKPVRVTVVLLFCRYAGGTGPHWHLQMGVVSWWRKPGLDRALSLERSVGHMERARPMQRIQKKREVPTSLRCGQALLSAVVQFTDEVNWLEDSRDPIPKC